MDTGVIIRKGQITIPATIRRALHLREGDRVTFSLEDGGFTVRRAESIVAQTYGILKSDLPSLTAEELREAAMDAIAEGCMERSGLPS